MRKRLFKQGIILFLSLVMVITYTTPSFAQSPDNLYLNLPQVNASNLTYDTNNLNNIISVQNGVFVKQSIEDIIKIRPDLKNKIYRVLKEKNALNADGSIKSDSQIQSSAIHPETFLGTGTEYIFVGRFPYSGSMLAPWTTETVWSASNRSSSPQSFNVSNRYTQGCIISASVSINSTAALDSAFFAAAGVTLSYTYSESASRQYGATITLPAWTRGQIDGEAYVICYGFRQKYYVLGVLISDDPVGVFKPTGVDWTYTESSIPH